MRRVRRSLRALACLLLLGGLTVLATPGPATAASTLMCSSYARCTQAGLGNDGYASAGKKMYWRMYAGHNCTNYVAYRMVRSGLPDVRPWTGSGNATNWGVAQREVTDQAPKVGAVAWWRAHANPAGAAGHVAYVERVLSATEIVVSQDSWGGDFSWRRITRDSGSWPSGFVHLSDVPMTSTALPTLTGTAKVGRILTARPGSWSVAGVTLGYRWLADGVVVPGATGSTLQLARAQVHRRISVQVTASRVGYPTASAASTATVAVAPALIGHTGGPSVSGVPQVASTLVAVPGTWTPAPVRLAFQWSADEVPVAGGTAERFTPGPAQVGRRLTVTVTASRSGYAALAVTSPPTAAVARATMPPVPAAVVTGLPRIGQGLRAQSPAGSPGSPGSGKDTVRLQWLRAGDPVARATGSTYQVTAADLGTRLRVRSTVSRPGYTDLVTVSRPTARVRAVPVLQVDTRPGAGRLTLTVTLTAPGVAVVPGEVRVRSAGQPPRTLTLSEGSVGTTLTGLPRGERTVRVRYLTSRTVSGVGTARTVRIP